MGFVSFSMYFTFLTEDFLDWVFLMISVHMILEYVRKKMESVCVNTMILKEGKKDKKMNSHKMRGKMKIF